MHIHALDTDNIQRLGFTCMNLDNFLLLSALYMPTFFRRCVYYVLHTTV